MALEPARAGKALSRRGLRPPRGRSGIIGRLADDGPAAPKLPAAHEVQDVADIDKEAFIASVVHDLRAPLNACLMTLSLLELKASEPTEVLRAAEVMRRNLDRQAQLVGDLGDALQIVGGGIRLALGPIDLSEVVDEAIEDPPKIAADRGVAIRWAQPRRALRVEADAERLAQAFGTLVDIVAAFGERGDTLGVRAEGQGEAVRLEARLEREPRGTAAGEASGRKQKGFAMPLAIAQHIVERHGGAVQLDESLPGFTLRLPLLRG